MIGISFILNSILLGVGLAMDAFSVSMANGLHDPGMSRRRSLIIAGAFAFFQALMPMAGWIFVRTIVSWLHFLQRYVPWISLGLLVYIGAKMILEGIRDSGREVPAVGKLTGKELLMQGIATSLDALSVGFTLEEYAFRAALSSAIIIGAVTFVICIAGVYIGRRFGMRLAGKADILGGIILIGIGLEIFIKGIFF